MDHVQVANGAEVLQVTGAARLSRDRQLNAAHPAEPAATAARMTMD